MYAYPLKIFGISYDGYASIYDIKDEIDGTNSSIGRVPMVAVWDVTPGDDHMVLIIGYNGNNVIFNDPENASVSYSWSYQDFNYKANVRSWKQYLRLDSRPPTPIPTGTGPNELVLITSAPTTISQTPQTLSFTAYKYGDHIPVTWTWRLIFPHLSDDCVTATWTSNSSDRTSNWNISNFVLPIGYKWKYNFEGNIPGRIEVLVADNAGPPAHDDAKDIVFTPSTLYPGRIDYEYMTISSQQPEVKAHEMITLRQDQFNSGTNIDLRSGFRIDITDGVTINNGSSVDFVIDPSLW